MPPVPLDSPLASAVPWVACAGAAAAAITAGLAFATFSPRSNFWAPVVRRGDEGGPPRYALTFDDGPTDGATDAILDTLGEMKARAAFFVIGVNVRRAPRLVRRMFDEGHVVANHSYDHSHFGVFGLGGYWERQLRETDDLVEGIIGRRPALFRPPMGIRTGHCANAAVRTGHRIVTWTRRGLDGITTTSERIVGRLAPATRAGDILILHDGVNPHLKRRDPGPTVRALGPLIAALRGRGLEPAGLEELAGVGGYQA